MHLVLNHFLCHRHTLPVSSHICFHLTMQHQQSSPLSQQSHSATRLWGCQTQQTVFISKNSMQLSIRHYKHQQGNRPFLLEITAKSRHCPILAMKRYLRVRGSSPGPLFIFADHTPISASYFARQLATCLSPCGYNTTMYTGHSFRIGAATTAAERGCTDIQIQTMGRWKSNAFRRYIRIPMMHSS